MKKTLKLLLLAGIASFFVACGGNGLVELTDEGQDKELHKQAVKAFREKYPEYIDYKLYSKESLKTMDYLKNHDKFYRAIINQLDKEKSWWGTDGLYINYFILFKNKANIKAVYVACNKNNWCDVNIKNLF